MEGAACCVCIRIFIKPYPRRGYGGVPAFAEKARAFKAQAHKNQIRYDGLMHHRAKCADMGITMSAHFGHQNE